MAAVWSAPRGDGNEMSGTAMVGVRTAAVGDDGGIAAVGAPVDKNCGVQYGALSQELGRLN